MELARNAEGQLSLREGGHAVSWRRVAAGLRASPEVRALLSRAVADAPYEALFFETVPVSAATADDDFAFVLVDSPSLARVTADSGPFARRLGEGIATFANLGGDAVLVVPPATGDYPHLAAFVRTAPADLVEALWQAVGAAVERWWAERARRVWVSTSGLGVYWLHVRLDSRPKYYTYAPFKRP